MSRASFSFWQNYKTHVFETQAEGIRSLKVILTHLGHCIATTNTTDMHNYSQADVHANNKNK